MCLFLCCVKVELRQPFSGCHGEIRTAWSAGRGFIWSGYEMQAQRHFTGVHVCASVCLSVCLSVFWSKCTTVYGLWVHVWDVRACEWVVYTSCLVLLYVLMY